MITSGQIRAARALLRWTADQLAKQAGIGVATIRRLELMHGIPAVNVRTLEALKVALETGGVEFIGAPNDRPGVRLRSGGEPGL